MTQILNSVSVKCSVKAWMINPVKLYTVKNIISHTKSGTRPKYSQSNAFVKRLWSASIPKSVLCVTSSGKNWSNSPWDPPPISIRSISNMPKKNIKQRLMLNTILEGCVNNSHIIFISILCLSIMRKNISNKNPSN